MKKIFFLFILCLLFTGCAKQRASRPAAATPKTSFGTTVIDTSVEVPGTFLPLKASQPHDDFSISSKSWLELSSLMIEVGKLAQGKDGDLLVKDGQHLAQEFYGMPYSHTVMTATSQPIGNPYLDVAAPEAKPILVQKWAEGIDSVKAKVTVAATQVNVVLGDLSQNPLPETVIQRVVDGLRGFKSLLIKSKDGTGDAVIDQITDSIDKDYIKGLENLRDSSHIGKNIPLSVSLKKIGQSLKNLSEVSESQRERLLVSVNWGVSLALRTEAFVQAQDAIVHLVDFWLNKYFRDMFPASLKDLFKNLTEKEILALATNNQGPLFSSSEWVRVKARTDYISMPDLEIVGQYLQNNGTVLNVVDWNKLKTDQVVLLSKLLQTKEVKDLVDLLSVNEKVTSIDEKKAVIINNWLGLSNRLCFPENLKMAFAMFNDQDLELLKADQKTFNDTLWLAISGHAKIAIAHHKILLGIETFGAKPGQLITAAEGLNNFRNYFQDQITAATRLRMDNAIVPIAKTLSSLLSGTLIPLLEKQKDSGDKIAGQAFNVYGRYYMGTLVFGVKGLKKEDIDSDYVTQDNALINKYPLPILEKSTLKFNFKDGAYKNLSTDDVTSAETLGTALTNIYFRLQNPDQTETPTEAIGLNFQPIAKMLAIAGYKGADAQLTESLSAPMTPGHDGELLDIHHYDPSKIVFASPDQIFIKDQYKMDQKSTKDAQVSVAGQMRLLRGYAQMMRFFKPWEKSFFDSGLGALRMDEAPSLKAFDKNDFFLLGLGLSSIVLKNIPLKMMGLITDKGAFVESSSVSDPSQIPAIGAVLGNYNADKMSHVISTKDMALSINSVAEFYDVVKDIEKSEDPALIEALKSSPPAAIRAQLAKLLSGMILFSTGRLMSQDGGFAVSYDGDSGKVSTEARNLEDQLLMERALLTAGRVLDSNFILARAADNFFFLNGHLWDPELGFYRESESAEKDKTVNLTNVALALENNLELVEVLPREMTQGATNSVQQLQKLKTLWMSRFFNAEILQGASVNQVLEYSL